MIVGTISDNINDIEPIELQDRKFKFEQALVFGRKFSAEAAFSNVQLNGFSTIRRTGEVTLSEDPDLESSVLSTKFEMDSLNVTMSLSMRLLGLNVHRNVTGSIMAIVGATTFRYYKERDYLAVSKLEMDNLQFFTLASRGGYQFVDKITNQVLKVAVNFFRDRFRKEIQEKLRIFFNRTVSRNALLKMIMGWYTNESLRPLN